MDAGRRSRADDDLTGRVATVLDAAVDVLAVDDIGVMLLDDRDELRVLGASGEAGRSLEDAQIRARAGPGNDAVRLGRPVVVPDLAHAPDYARVWERLSGADGGRPARAVLSVPVLVDGVVAGNVTALRVEPWGWSDDEVRAVQAYAGTLGSILRQAALADRSRAEPVDPS